MGSRAWRSPRACAAARSRSSRASRPRPRRRTSASWRPSASATPTRCSPTTAARSTSRWPTCCARAALTIATAESCTGGLLAGAADRSRRLVGLRAGRARRLLQRGEGRRWRASIRRSSSAWARSRSRSPRRWPTARGRALGADVGVGITGVAGPGRRDAREAGRARVLQRGRAGGRRLTRSVNLPGRSGRHPRSLDHRRHAPVRRLLLTASARLATAAALSRVRASSPRSSSRPTSAPRWRPSGARPPRTTGRCGPSREDALHLTLAFLGHRALDEVDPRARPCAAWPARPAPCWPRRPAVAGPAPPHVLTVGLEDADGVLAALQAAVVARLADALPWEPEARPFRPHITVARVRRGGARGSTTCPRRPQATFTAGAVVLFRSHLGGRGPCALRAARARGAGARSAHCARAPQLRRDRA